MEIAIAVRDAAFWWMGVWLAMNAITFAMYSVWKCLRHQRGKRFLRELQKLHVTIGQAEEEAQDGTAEG